MLNVLFFFVDKKIKRKLWSICEYNRNENEVGIIVAFFDINEQQNNEVDIATAADRLNKF